MKYNIKIFLLGVIVIAASSVKAQLYIGSNTVNATGSAIGTGNTSNGGFTFASGVNNNVTNSYGIGMGLGTQVTAQYSASIGIYSYATGYVSYSIGNRAKATGYEAHSIGSFSQAIGTHSYTYGQQSITSGDYAYTLGRYSGGSGDYAFSLGHYAVANGANSYAIGEYVSTSSTGSITIGRGLSSGSKLNNGTTNSLAIGFNSNIPTLFVGASSGAGTTGNVGIATTSPNHKLDVEGNMSINKHDIYLYDGSDVNHGLGWYGTGKGFAGVTTINGPVLYGWSGGALGTTEGGAQNVLSWNSDGEVGIGTTNTQGYKFAVKGNMIAEEVVVELYANWPDYVFGEKYSLKSLGEVEKFIEENNHLPNVPSEVQVKEDGINLGEMDAILLQKIEELTLYTISQQKLIEEQGRMIEELKKSKN